MAAPINLEDLPKLKSFVEFVAKHPEILNLPQLNFLKKLIEQLGGKVPEGTFQMPAGGAKCPFGGDVKSESKSTPPPPASADEDDEEIPEMEAESEESEVELDMEANEDSHQPKIEPIQFLEEKPLKIVERLKTTRRKLSSKKVIKKKRKSRKSNAITTTTTTSKEKIVQLKQNIKLEMENLLEDNDDQGSYQRTVTNDPLFTPQVEMKCDETEEKFKPFSDNEEEEQSEKYNDSDDDKDYFMDNYEDDDDYVEQGFKNKNELKKVKMEHPSGGDDNDDDNADDNDDDNDDDNGDDDDDDDEPLILLAKKSPRQTYKKSKNPRLKDCLATCKHKCSNKYDRQQRLDIYHFYWQLSAEDKISFIRTHVRKPVSKHIRSKNIRNNCCYFLKYYKMADNTSAIGDEAEDEKECQREGVVEGEKEGEIAPPAAAVKNNIFNDDDDDLMKVCRVFFHGTLKISEHEIKEAIKDFELKPEKVRPLRDPKLEEDLRLARELLKKTQKPQQYLDPETGDLTDTKPKRKFKRRKPGDPQPERFPKPVNCAIRCKFKCHEKFSEPERKQICDIFWSLDFKRRKDFILSRIETTDVKTPTTPEFRKTNRPTRAYQAKFFLRSGLKSENIRVCKHFLVNTLLINRWFIENAIEFADKTTGAYTGTDRRGTHSSHYKISDDRKQVVLNHISSYPYWIPNKKSKTKYLHYSLTIKKMYEAYKEKCLAKNIEYVTLHYYYKIFHANFHVLFLANPNPKKGGGFLKANPNISHFTGEEPGGYWIDSEGTKLDLRSINPGLSLDEPQNCSPPSNFSSPSSFITNTSSFASATATHALNLVHNPFKVLVTQQQQQLQQQSSIASTFDNLPADSVNMFRML